MTPPATLATPFAMLLLRRLIGSNPHLAALVCAAALAMKLLVPAGYMLSAEHGRIAITLCSGMGPQFMAPHSMATDISGMSGMDHAMTDGGSSTNSDPSSKHDKPEMPCAFSSLSTQALGSVDAVLLLAAIAFVMAIGLRPAPSRLRVLPRYLRPPLRGPPAAL